jgi:hypothetical protein
LGVFVVTTQAALVHTDTSPRWPFLVFRLTSLASAVMLFDQAVFAGRFLSGDYSSLETHRENATYAGISVLVSVVAAVLVRRPGRGPWWPIAGCAGIFGLIAVQIVLGFARVIALHIPLGVAIILLALALAVGSWRL